MDNNQDKNEEIIKVIIDNDMRVKQEKGENADTDKEDEGGVPPKTAKDLFSDFRPESDSDCQYEESSDSDSEPLMKRVKVKKEKADQPSKDRSGHKPYKKVCCNGYHGSCDSFVILEI